MEQPRYGLPVPPIDNPEVFATHSICHCNKDFTSDPPDYIAGGVFKFLVGPEQKEYLVHKDLLCAHSEHFAMLLREDSKDKMNQAVYLDVETSVFDEVATFIYRQTILEQGLPKIAVYALADKFIMKGLKNAITSRFISVFRASNMVPHPRMLCVLQNHKLEQSQLYRYAIRSFVSSFLYDKQPWMGNEADKAELAVMYEAEHHNVLKSVMQMITESRAWPSSPRLDSPCVYHERLEGVPDLKFETYEDNDDDEDEYVESEEDAESDDDASSTMSMSEDNPDESMQDDSDFVIPEDEQRELRNDQAKDLASLIY